MTAAVEPVAEGPVSCWCCGGEFSEHDVVRLGSHPEVAVCPGCARYLHRQARALADHDEPSMPGRARGVVRGARTWVVSRGWHRLPVIGPLLQRLDRHLP
jgi:hypothetical protein